MLLLKFSATSQLLGSELMLLAVPSLMDRIWHDGRKPAGEGWPGKCNILRIVVSKILPPTNCLRAISGFPGKRL